MSEVSVGFIFRDSDTAEPVWVPPQLARCEACGSRDRLCIDHDRWVRRPAPDRARGFVYRRRVLCLGCNLKKGNRRYIPYGDGTCWLPSMPVGARLPRAIVMQAMPVGRDLVRSASAKPAKAS